MRNLLFGLSTVVMSFMLAHPAQSQAWLSTPGIVGATTLTVGHATLRLPPGEWRELADEDDVPLQAQGRSLVIRSKVVAQVIDGEIAALILARSNETRSPWGWRADSDCGRRDANWFENLSEYDKTYNCLLVTYSYSRFRESRTGIWHTANTAAAAFGGIPKPMIQVAINQASQSRLDFITVRLFLNPAQSGLSGGQNDDQIEREWKAGNIDVARQAYLDRIINWAKAYRSIVSDAF